MPYTSDFTDNEWLMLEPLMPGKKLTRPLEWTKPGEITGIAGLRLLASIAVGEGSRSVV